MRIELSCATVAILVALSGVARADGPEREAMLTYFAGEKRGGLTLVGMGAVGIGGGALMLTRDSEVAEGASYPLLGLGVAHLAAGVFVYIASDNRIDTFNKAIDDDPAAWTRGERDRVREVRTQFLVLKIVETALIAAGAGAAIYGFASDEDLIAGVGVGVAVEAAATLVFDVFADRRADRYLGSLEP